MQEKLFSDHCEEIPVLVYHQQHYLYFLFRFLCRNRIGGAFCGFYAKT